MMRSESARMSSAAEARFRIAAPNSRPRAVKVIALDADAERLVRGIDAGDWPHASFLVASTSAGTVRLADLDGVPRDLESEIAAADLVVMVAGPTGRADAAAAIGAECSRRRVTTTGFVVGAVDEAEISGTLAQLRPWSLMVVIARSDDYIRDMMTALRA